MVNANTTETVPFVVCCSDGSGESAHAINIGLSLLAPATFQPTLVQVIPPISPQMVSGIDTGMSLGAYADVDVAEQYAHQRQQARAQLQQMSRALGLVNSAEEVLSGSASHAIRDFAEDEGADLIIVGRQGMGALDRLLMGSVSQYLVRKAPCPVLVIGGGAKADAKGPVLLATDDSPQAHRAAGLASALLNPDIPLQAVTVSEKAPVVGDDGLAELRARTDQGESADIDAHLSMDLHGRQAETVVLHGQPATALVDYANQVDARALVLGTHGRGGFLRAVLGSVANDVLTNATCPVFIAGPHSRT